MNEYHDVSGLILLSAVIVGVVALYLISGLIGVAVTAAVIDLVLRRIEARRLSLAVVRERERKDPPPATK